MCRPVRVCFKDAVIDAQNFLRLSRGWFRAAGIDPNSYETVRVGMNVADAIRRGVIDTGIGFINFQKVELEEMCGEEVVMLR